MTTDNLQSVTNMAGQTYKVGQRVKSNDGWIGTITAIKVPRQGAIRLLVNPDKVTDVPVHQYWLLNAQAALQAGKPDYCQPRDSGMSMGNFKPLEG